MVLLILWGAPLKLEARIQDRCHDVGVVLLIRGETGVDRLSQGGEETEVVLGGQSIQFGLQATEGREHNAG